MVYQYKVSKYEINPDLTMTADEYHTKVATFDQDRIDQAIARIPLNINRAGKYYRKLVKQIYETHKFHQRDYRQVPQ